MLPAGLHLAGQHVGPHAEGAKGLPVLRANEPSALEGPAVARRELLEEDGRVEVSVLALDETLDVAGVRRPHVGGRSRDRLDHRLTVLLRGGLDLPPDAHRTDELVDLDRLRGDALALLSRGGRGGGLFRLVVLALLRPGPCLGCHLDSLLSLRPCGQRSWETIGLTADESLSQE